MSNGFQDFSIIWLDFQIQSDHQFSSQKEAEKIVHQQELYRPCRFLVVAWMWARSLYCLKSVVFWQESQLGFVQTRL